SRAWTSSATPPPPATARSSGRSRFARKPRPAGLTTAAFSPPASKASRRQAKPSAHFGSDALGYSQRRLHLPRRRPHAGIAIFDGVLREARNAPSQWRQSGVVGQEQVKKVSQIMRPWHGGAEFLEEGFQELFGRLLAVEGRRVSRRRRECGQLSCRGHVL